jgi:cell division protein FtsZ
VRRRLTADAATDAIAAEVDALLAIPNDRLRDVTGRSTLLIEAFSSANDVLRSAVGGISDMITVPGLINLDFADIRAVMAGAGTALLGVGSAEGEGRARAAADRALTSPLVGSGAIRGATGIIVNISAGPSLTLAEVAEAAEAVNEIADGEANVIIGTSLDQRYGDALTVTVIATGFERVSDAQPAVAGAAYAYTPVAYPVEPAYAEVARFERTPFPGSRQPGTTPPPAPTPAASATRIGGWLSRFTVAETTGAEPYDLDVPAFMRRRR